ncbi:hypothetical protein T09_12264 [Trichinella sp. T9]|nr:hypothetical protein T09_12264 [Trichinella sp. T9]
MKNIFEKKSFNKKASFKIYQLTYDVFINYKKIEQHKIFIQIALSTINFQYHFINGMTYDDKERILGKYY